MRGNCGGHGLFSPPYRGTEARELRSDLASQVPLETLVDRVRAGKALGITREEAQRMLEELRGETTVEVVENRILEVWDFVTGFCSAEQAIWPDDGSGRGHHPVA